MHWAAFSRIVITNFRKLAALSLRDLPERNLPIGQNDTQRKTLMPAVPAALLGTHLTAA